MLLQIAQAQLERPLDESADLQPPRRRIEHRRREVVAHVEPGVGHHHAADQARGSRSRSSAARRGASRARRSRRRPPGALPPTRRTCHLTRFTASNPAARSESVTAADRPPDRHTTTIPRSRGSSCWRSETWPIGIDTRIRSVLRPATRRARERRAAPHRRRSVPSPRERRPAGRRPRLAVSLPVEVGSPAVSHAP